MNILGAFFIIIFLIIYDIVAGYDIHLHHHGLSLSKIYLDIWYPYLIKEFCDFIDFPEKCPEIVTKTRWGGRVAKEIAYIVIPVHYVIIHHTVTPRCKDEHTCTDLLKNIQNYHMNELRFHDIGYNFLIGGDGRIYEGAGWHRVGGHTKKYNTRSLGLAFIGNYTNELPNPKQLRAAMAFLQCAVELGELDGRYKLLGGRQVGSTQSPGLRLYKEIQNWKHFTMCP